eukprot:SAG31_NODE_9945_length_1207_cov_1.052347_1_plen_239_part_10
MNPFASVQERCPDEFDACMADVGTDCLTVLLVYLSDESGFDRGMVDEGSTMADVVTCMSGPTEGYESTALDQTSGRRNRRLQFDPQEAHQILFGRGPTRAFTELAYRGIGSAEAISLVITFSVVLITTRCMPYKNDATDRYKVVMDVNLFFTFSCTLMLKLNLAGEILQPAFFDCKPRQRLYCCGLEKRHTNTLIFCVTDAMVTSNLIIGGIPVVWSVINSAKSIYGNTLQVKLIIRM